MSVLGPDIQQDEKERNHIKQSLTTNERVLAPSATQVLPGLWIGDRFAANNLGWLQEKNIGAVVNCTRSQGFASGPSLKQALRVPVRDNLEEDEILKMSKYLEPVTEKVHEWIKHHNVLVHCYAGRQRSSAVVLAYLIRYGDIPLQEAIELLQSKRPITCRPKCNFYNALLTFQHTVDHH